jgi:aspartyl-tRNA(Asn)/glutamyl-tRNA(Gln) amidotransferase subunit A
VIDGQTVGATYLQGATVPLNVTGLPGVSMRFGASAKGMPINVQIVGKWQAERPQPAMRRIVTIPDVPR